MDTFINLKKDVLTLKFICKNVITFILNFFSFKNIQKQNGEKNKYFWVRIDILRGYLIIPSFLLRG